MSEETVETAARRIVRFVRVDDAAHGGLLSRDTIRAAEMLDAELRKLDARCRRKEALKVVGDPDERESD
jgi:hypothetical protein